MHNNQCKYDYNAQELRQYKIVQRSISNKAYSRTTWTDSQFRAHVI